MKTYIVTAVHEVEAANEAEAEDIIMTLVPLDDDAPAPAMYTEIKEVKELV